MKKRLFSVLMMLVMLVAAMAITAQAATVPENVEWIELGSKEDFLYWFGGGSGGKNMTENYSAGMTRYYKFTDDIIVDEDSKAFYLANATYEVNTYFDLNGHTLTYTSPVASAGRMFGSYNTKTSHTFVNGTIVNNSNINAYGAMFIMTGDLTIEDMVLIDNATSMSYNYAGKIIASTAGDDVTLINVDITTGSAGAPNNGMAIRSEKGNLTMIGCNMTSSSTKKAGNGGIVYQNAGSLTITDCTFTNGFAKNGGNVYATATTVTISGSTFTGGHSETGGQGGNIAIYDSTATITDCTFNNGFATKGGNVYATATTVTISGSTFTGGRSEAGGQGGNIAIYDSTATITDSTFVGGNTTPDFGGNLFLQGTTATITGATITGGKAKWGGAIYSVNKPVTLENCTVSGGTATVEGGNIQQKNGAMTLINTNVSGGKSSGTGGNISVANTASVYFKSGKIENGSAKNGGNVAVSIGAATGPTLYLQGMDFIGGTATENGGNLHIASHESYAGKPTVAYSAGKITGGTAAGNGGNVFLSGLSNKFVTFTMTGGVIGGTPAQGKTYAGEAKNGGNLFGQYATITISGGECSNAYASTNGGNLYPSTACTMNISGTAVVSGGVTKNNGGNFYMSSTNTVLNITGGTIQNGYANLNGGNIYHGNGKLTITGGVITGGHAEASGGNIQAVMGYGDKASACGAMTIKDDGNPDTPLAQITNGVANQSGGNISILCSGNIKETGANKVILGNFVVSGGDAKANGDQIYMAGVTILEILPEFAQEIPCYIDYYAIVGLLPEKLPGNAFANNRGISTGEFTGKLVVENYENTFVFAKDGTLYFAGAATVAADGTKTWYKTNEEAVAAYADAAYLQAAPGELVLPEGAYVVDLAGQTVAITGAGSVTLFDSANDDFATFGTATIEGVQLLNTALTRVLNKDYYTMEAEGAYSFHRVEARLTSVALRPSVGGIYYTAKWSCDDTVKPLVEGFGLAVSMKNFPGTGFANDETALYTVFAADAFESGVTKTGAMIAGILKDTTPERIAMNSIYAQMDIFAEAYITINGETYTGIGANYSMYDILKIVEQQLNAYYVQAPVMQDFMTQWSAKGLVGEPWDSLDFNVSEDVITLNTLYAGLQPYYGELHDHAYTGGTSDGKQPLSVWKSELERLKMDFTTSMDHQQSLHMYLDEWDDSIFIGGSEAATTITDRTGVKLHYNMIFSDPKGLEAVVSSFPEFNWKYYPEDDADTKRAGGWHFGYPSFTAARFTEVCQAVYDNGGFVALVHPKSEGYITSDDPADAYFMDGIAIEVFYTYFTTRDGWQTKANHKLWTDMMKAGYKVYATAGNDEHDMPSDKAVSVIYSAERNATAWVEQLRKGQFVAGGVGVRSAMGDTMMGGTTSFQGKRFTFSVGDFHTSLLDPTHTYRADVYDQNGVVFSREVSATETTYMAFDADNASNYYYIEIYDVTADSMIAIGNPIWNEK